jgi:hypothetical protein
VPIWDIRGISHKVDEIIMKITKYKWRSSNFKNRNEKKKKAAAAPVRKTDITIGDLPC